MKRDVRGRFLSAGMRGSDNPLWKGGEIIDNYGYVRLLKPEHPRANNKGYVKRAIVIYENMTGRRIKRGEVVHHKDGNRQNDSFDNLQLMTVDEHKKVKRVRLDEERVARLYVEGESTKSLAEMFNVCKSTIGKIIKRQGLECRSYSEAAKLAREKGRH